MDEQLMDTEKKARRLPTWVVAIAFVILFAFLALIAWGLRLSQEGPISIGDSVSPFVLTTFDGNTINTADYQGKVIVVNFWASWCSPCEEEAAAMETAWRSYQSDGEVIFLGVDYVDTEPEAMEFLNKYNITYPNGPDLRSEISDLFRIRGVPETYIIDRQGNLAFVKKGPFSSVSDIQYVIDGFLE
jgi:cytochrome c biogenesis protein CcmG/thiol:disulfide interchange protein DsbE